MARGLFWLPRECLQNTSGDKTKNASDMADRRTSWCAVQQPDGSEYYYDDPDLGGTGETTWEKPKEIEEAEAPPAAAKTSRRASWTEIATDEGKKYYYDDPTLGGTGETTWEKPKDFQTNRGVEYELKSAASSSHLKRFMKRKLVQNPVQLDATNKKIEAARSARLARLRAKRNGSQVFEEFETDDGQIYYTNVATNETVWELPPGALLKELEDSISFRQEHDDGGSVYFINVETGETVWELPGNGVLVD